MGLHSSRVLGFQLDLHNWFSPIKFQHPGPAMKQEVHDQLELKGVHLLFDHQIKFQNAGSTIKQ